MRRSGRSSVGLVLVLVVLQVPDGLATDLPAGPDPTPNAPSSIRTAYDVRFRSALDGFDVSLRLLIGEAEGPNGLGVPAQAIRDGGPAARDAFEAQVRARFQKELGQAFAGAIVAVSQVSFDYGASDLDADPYTPAIVVAGLASATLTPAFLGLPGKDPALAASAARAFLYSGGAFRLDRALAVPPGFQVALAVHVPPALRLSDPGHTDATRLDFRADNLRSTTTARLPIRFTLALESSLVPANVLAGPLVRAKFYAFDETPVWMQVAPFTNGRYSADLDLRLDLNSLPASVFERNSPFPADVRLRHVSADLLRVAAQAHLVEAADLHAFFEALIARSLRADYGDHATVTMDKAAFDRSLRHTVGGADGATVQPLVIRAQAHLPLRSDRMLFSSALGRSAGMVAPLHSSFQLANDGPWDFDLTILYPEGVKVSAKDSLHRVRTISEGDRDGFSLFLAKGESTKVTVTGRAPFQPAVFAVALLEVAALAAAGWWMLHEYRSGKLAGLPRWAARLFRQKPEPQTH